MTRTQLFTRFRRSPGALREFVVTAALFGYVEWLLRRAPLSVVASRMRLSVTQTDGSTTSEPDDDNHARLPEWAIRRLRAVERVSRWWRLGRSGPCLRSSLVAGRRLAVLDPELHLGVKRDGEKLRAHAWVRVGTTDFDLDPGDWAPLPLQITRSESHE